MPFKFHEVFFPSLIRENSPYLHPPFGKVFRFIFQVGSDHKKMPSLIREIWGICWGVFQKIISKKFAPTLIREKSAYLHPPLRKVF